MSLEQLETIDAIGVDIETGIANLAIIDDLDWEDEGKHLTMLQSKINLYLGFIESGDIYENYPDSKGRNLGIKIFSKHDIPEIGIKFINKAYEVITDAGFTLSCEITGD
jgi:hypothetical protein